MLRAVTSNLDFGKRGIVYRGSLFPRGWLHDKSLETLISRGIVAEVSAPPLDVLQGYHAQARKLKKHLGRRPTVDDYLEMDSVELATILDIERDAVEQAKSALIKLFEVQPAKG